MGLPSVFAYVDYRTFLRDWFDARKRDDARYSHAAFAAAGGCSKSTLANVLSGARSPRSDTLDAFARAIEMTPSERNYLGLLAELSMAQDLDRRRAVMERILSSERYRQVRVAERDHDSTLFRYLEHWYLPVIRELAAQPGFRADPAWIADIVRPRITAEQASDALQTLFDLDFLHRGPDGAVEVREVRFRTEPDSAHHAVAYYHREVVSGLLRELDTAQHHDQHLVAATITLPASLIPEVKARLNKLVEQVGTLGDDPGAAGVQDGGDAGRKVYLIATQLLAVSDELG